MANRYSGKIPVFTKFDKKMNRSEVIGGIILKSSSIYLHSVKFRIDYAKKTGVGYGFVVRKLKNKL